MCGIACLINNNGFYTPENLFRFTDAVSHRGPDGRGFAFFDSECGKLENPASFTLGLGHRRLSIIDLSKNGSQPMFFNDPDYAIVYNGEIYNYVELKEELEEQGIHFKSSSDTEVLLAAYVKWGRNCLNRLNGMWAFVIFDRKERKLFISRDRMGVKPLYYWRKGNNLALASEIKQFFSLPDFKVVPNKNVCLSYLATGYENPPETFYQEVYSFPAGHFAEIILKKPEISPEKFWFPEKIPVEKHDEIELVSKIGRTFFNAVKFRLRSDVPVGGCLSGGLDSSSIFVMMRNLQSKTIFNAFSACFEKRSIDERSFMREMVEQTGSNHIMNFPKAEEFIEDIGSFLSQHDEPVGSMSMYAQYRVMKSARENKVPVLLDGQGGDELFSGYWPAYLLFLNYLRGIGGYGEILSHLSGAFMPGGNISLLSQITSGFCEYRRRANRILPFSIKKDYEGEIKELPAFFWHLKAKSLFPEEYRKAEILKIHLPRLLKWEDINSMAFSIESRVPFLDVNLIELLLSVPPKMNMRKGWTKYLLRKVMEHKLPDNICWRKDKKGFETPQDDWMKSGAFHKFLLKWAAENEHPASEFISDKFIDIHDTISKKEFQSVPMFRLFCLDFWLKNLASR